MAEYEDGIFSNLPQRRLRADDDNRARSFFRELRGMYVPEGPLPPRPERSGKGGPSLGVSNAPPVGSASPVVTGTPAVGQTLSCDNGVWFNAPTSYTYQWLRDGANIAGATASTYVVVSGDLGHAISCKVTATNANGSTPATSNAVLIVAIPVNTVAPAITGTATVGSTLSCSQGTWTNSPTSYAYQWLQNGVNISGATASSYVVVTGDAGTSIRCTVTASNATASGSATSNALAIAALPSAPSNTVAPVVSGTATIGSTLSCNQGTWTNSPTGYTYQWQRNGVDTSGATGASYVTVTADGGTSVSCRVTATNAAGNTSAASNALAVLGVPANTAAPVASGALTVGSTLSCTSGTWTNSPTYTYQWQRGGANISGATSSTYVTVTADGGTSVGCLVTATNASGSASAPSNTLAIAGSGMSAQAAAYLARTVGGNEGGNATNIATLIDGLVADGVWAKLDALYVLAQQNATDALLNLIGASYSLTSNGTFTTYKGYSGFAVPGMATGFNATLGGANFSQNSSSLGAWSYAITADAAGVIATGDDLTGLYPGFSGTFYYRLNGSGSLSAGPSPTKGLVAGDRSSSTAVSGYINGAGAGSTSASSVAINNSPFYVGASASFGATTQTISAAFIGASLGSAGQLALYNRLRTYMTAIGVP